MKNRTEAVVGPTRFVVLGAERTGSNLLSSLLYSHPEGFVGGELFNKAVVDTDQMPWEMDTMLAGHNLADLWKSDSVAFLDRMFATAGQRGYRAIGFKLMYAHGDDNELVRDYLTSDTSIRVVHIMRRNLLRRYLSEQVAQRTGVWDRTDETTPPPPIHLELEKCLWNFNYIETKQREYAEHFKNHDTMEVYYEDLAADLLGIGTRVAAFLGLQPNVDLKTHYKKGVTQSLQQAIVNYDDLKSHILRWASFFEE